LLQPPGVEQVLRAADGSLGFDELMLPDNGDGDAAVGAFRPVLPGGGEFDRADIHDDINAVGGDPDLINKFRVGEIPRFDPSERGAETGQGAKDAGGVFGTGVYPDIQVFGEARLGVKHHRVGADDQVFNAFGV